MRKNEIVSAEIEALTNEGCGVARADGMVIFVPYCAVGDKLDIRIVKVGKSHCYGIIEKIISPSRDRIIPDCTAFGRCGGCDFRHISYEAELAAKEEFIRGAFTRIGKLSPQFLPIIPDSAGAAYRNKTQYPVRRGKDGETLCGFFAERSHRVITCEHCLLEPEIFAEIRAFVLKFARENGISPYNEEEHSGVLRSVCIRKGHYSGEIGVCVVVRRNVPQLKRLGAALHEKFPGIVSVTANVNTDKTNVIYGEKEFLLFGEIKIKDTMCGRTFAVSARSFYQVNTPMAEKLYRKAAELAEPDGKVVVDLYCGAGTIGLTMADRAKQLVGVEINGAAAANACENARLNGAENARFLCGDVGEMTDKLLSEGLRADVVIVDPARKGCDLHAIENIVKLGAPRIVMISCDPATAARDCAMLSERGYTVKSVQGVDLFSRTRHVEAVVLLTRNS